MFDKRQLKVAYKTLKIASEDLEILQSTLDSLAAC